MRLSLGKILSAFLFSSCHSAGVIHRITPFLEDKSLWPRVFDGGMARPPHAECLLCLYEICISPLASMDWPLPAYRYVVELDIWLYSDASPTMATNSMLMSSTSRNTKSLRGHSFIMKDRHLNP